MSAQATIVIVVIVVIATVVGIYATRKKTDPGAASDLPSSLWKPSWNSWLNSVSGNGSDLPSTENNGSDDPKLISTGPCAYGGANEGKFDDGYHCRVGPKKPYYCPDGPKKCWTYGNNRYYTMPKDVNIVPGTCAFGGTYEGRFDNGYHCRLDKADGTCPVGAPKCWCLGGAFGSSCKTAYYTIPFNRNPNGLGRAAGDGTQPE